jgi:hypothetical protein
VVVLLGIFLVIVGFDDGWADHVERYHVLERDVSCFVFFDEDFVHQFWTASCWKAEDKGFLGRLGMGFDPF